MNKEFKIITIEGNIGSGKSTLLEFLRNELILDNKKVIFMKEPVDEWEHIKDSNGTTMLQKFYENQEKYSFPFQMMAYISRLKLLKETVEKYPNGVGVTLEEITNGMIAMYNGQPTEPTFDAERFRELEDLPDIKALLEEVFSDELVNR